MLHGIKPRLSFANVVSAIALFIALGGTVYAAAKIDGKTIEKGSIPGNRLKPNKVTGKQVKESKLKLESTKSCPAGTVTLGAVCVEASQRGADDVFDASTICAEAGRRLPTASELVALSDIHPTVMDTDAELTSNIYADAPGNFQYISVNGQGTIDDPTTGVTSSFRCVAESRLPG